MTPISLLIGLLFTGAPSTEPVLPDTVRQALLDNAQQIAPIDVSLVERREMHLTTDEFVEKLNLQVPMADALARGTEQRLVFPGREGKLYAERIDEEAQPVQPGDPEPEQEIFQYSCDGRINQFVQHYHPPRDPSVFPQATYFRESLAERSKESPSGRFADVAYFEAAGIDLPIKMSQLLANAPAESGLLRLLDGGATLKSVDERAEIDGRVVTRIEVIGTNPVRASAEEKDPEQWRQKLLDMGLDEAEVARSVEEIRKNRELPARWVHVFWLDPKLNFAVVQSERQYEDGTLLRFVSCVDFVKLQGRDVYLPRKCVIETYSMPPAPPLGGPITTRTFVLRELKLAPPDDSLFTLEYREPGTFVRDRTDPENKQSYVIKPDGTTQPVGR